MTLQDIENIGTPHEQAAPASAIPLVVALEGGLISTPVRLEALAAALSAGEGAEALAILLRGGCGSMAAEIAGTLPLVPETVRLIENARAGARPVYLLVPERLLPLGGALAARLGSIDGLLPLESFTASPSAALKEAGLGPVFDYAGSATAKGGPWQGARQAFAIGMTARQAAAFRKADAPVLPLSAPGSSIVALLKLLRPHQYAKNLLVLVPLLTSHQMGLHSLFAALLAFVCFSLTASAVYVLNDFIDMHADRAHPTKKRRPFAAGTVPPALGLSLIPLLLFGAGLTATVLPPLFGLFLALYVGLTTAYSFSLKKMMLADVTVLSLLYTLRVVAGAAAIGVDMSEWLFAFSLLMFTALALTKRYVELSARLDRDLPDPSNRDYRITDLPVVAALAAAAGMNAITVLALYVNSETVKRLYAHPALLWLLCPLFLYWISRVLLLAHRRQLHDDPIVFALKDVRSWLVGALCLALMALAA